MRRACSRWRPGWSASFTRRRRPPTPSGWVVRWRRRAFVIVWRAEARDQAGRPPAEQRAAVRGHGAHTPSGATTSSAHDAVTARRSQRSMTARSVVSRLVERSFEERLREGSYRHRPTRQLALALQLRLALRRQGRHGSPRSAPPSGLASADAKQLFSAFTCPCRRSRRGKERHGT